MLPIHSILHIVYTLHVTYCIYIPTCVCVCVCVCELVHVCVCMYADAAVAGSARDCAAAARRKYSAGRHTQKPALSLHLLKVCVCRSFFDFFEHFFSAGAEIGTGAR